MTEKKKQVAIGILLVWLLVVMSFMILTRDISLVIYFVLCLIGLLVIVELVRPSFVRPAYFRYLTYLIAAGVIVFAVIVAEKVLEILSK